jgi:hypothetical protein
MASRHAVQSGHGGRSGRSGGGRGTGTSESRQENEQQNFPVDSPLWRYVTKIGKKEKNTGGSCLWNCNKCKVNFTGSYTRVKAHFLWLEGDNGVHHCKKIDRKDVDGFQAEQDAADLAKEERRSGRQKPISKRTNEVPLIVEEIRKRQNFGTLAKMFDMGGRDETDNRVARAIYACGIPFNVVWSPYWQDMLRAVNDAPKGYVGPNFEKVRTILLRKEKLMVEKILEPVRSCWSGNGISIISDGWTDMLSLQETLCGCRPEVLGNLRNECFLYFVNVDQWDNSI